MAGSREIGLVKIKKISSGECAGHASEICRCVQIPSSSTGQYFMFEEILSCSVPDEAEILNLQIHFCHEQKSRLGIKLFVC